MFVALLFCLDFGVKSIKRLVRSFSLHPAVKAKACELPIEISRQGVGIPAEHLVGTGFLFEIGIGIGFHDREGECEQRKEKRAFARLASLFS